MKYALALLVVMGSAASQASAQSTNRPEALVVTAQNLTASSTGREQPVIPGDVVQYRLQFTNTTRGPVRSVVFDNPVPEGLRYVAGSATAGRADITVSYSIDGGRTYSANPTVERVQEGRRAIVTAPAEMFTHVRWTVSGAVLPGATVSAEFRAEMAAR